jgi:hypothetical protein
MENVIDETTTKLRLSVAVQIIKNFIDSEYNRFYSECEPGLDYDELSNLSKAVNFYESQTGKKTGYRVSIEKELNEISR